MSSGGFWADELWGHQLTNPTNAKTSTSTLRTRLGKREVRRGRLRRCLFIFVTSIEMALVVRGRTEGSVVKHC